VLCVAYGESVHN